MDTPPLGGDFGSEATLASVKLEDTKQAPPKGKAEGLSIMPTNPDFVTASDSDSASPQGASNNSSQWTAESSSASNGMACSKPTLPKRAMIHVSFPIHHYSYHKSPVLGHH